MDIEKVLNNRDGECRNCADELAKGQYVYQHQLDPQIGMFCSEMCFAEHFEICTFCMGAGEVTTMEPVYPDAGSPTAPIGTRKCICQSKVVEE